MRLQRYRYRKGQLLAPLGGVVRDTRDDECVITDSCKRRTAALCTVPQQGSGLCNRPHGWKGVALRCRRSPRSELEVFYAQND